MKSFVIDTSVAVKWFSPFNENNLISAHRVLSDFQTGKIRALTSDLLLAELSNVLQTSKKFTSVQVKSAIQAIFHCRMKIFPITKNLIIKTAETASKYQITTYDAIFLSLAKREDCQLISADQKSHEKITDGSVVMIKNYQAQKPTISLRDR